MNYITDGGFPEIQSIRNKRSYVQSLIEAILQKDIQRRFKVRDVVALRKIANHLINNACQEVNYDDMARLLGISDKTTKKYVEYLQQAFLIQLLSRHSFKSRGRIRGEKAYVVDTGLQNYRTEAFAAENIGWRLENVVYLELLRRCSREYLDIYSYRETPRSKEVDFVICNQDKALELIQVAYEIDTPRTFERETSSLIKAAANLHCDHLTLIAFSPSRIQTMNGKEIHIISAIEWLLG